MAHIGITISGQSRHPDHVGSDQELTITHPGATLTLCSVHSEKRFSPNFAAWLSKMQESRMVGKWMVASCTVLGDLDEQSEPLPSTVAVAALMCSGYLGTGLGCLYVPGKGSGEAGNGKDRIPAVARQLAALAGAGRATEVINTTLRFSDDGHEGDLEWRFSAYLPVVNKYNDGLVADITKMYKRAKANAVHPSTADLARWHTLPELFRTWLAAENFAVLKRGQFGMAMTHANHLSPGDFNDPRWTPSAHTRISKAMIVKTLLSVSLLRNGIPPNDHTIRALRIMLKDNKFESDDEIMQASMGDQGDFGNPLKDGRPSLGLYVNMILSVTA